MYMFCRHIMFFLVYFLVCMYLYHPAICTEFPRFRFMTPCALMELDFFSWPTRGMFYSFLLWQCELIITMPTANHKAACHFGVHTARLRHAWLCSGWCESFWIILERRRSYCVKTTPRWLESWILCISWLQCGLLASSCMKNGSLILWSHSSGGHSSPLRLGCTILLKELNERNEGPV